ncbi:hypothetical protein BP00DRAFT_423472 [Aspergillus indologenus CBS 114.80]|uniref:Uncharacterized protein n=1 Tax=Aspergillus indologenus CBS 114.80 TaxID=1450541 RepID=A0A2V5IYS4_9EURO|nr:hypothetical protein BP00DRAFT_423472 [Aspergillus indologenus CBS 114.80]
MLDTLPPELLDLVVGQIASRRDLKRLCEVCTRLRNCALPHLYRSIVLSATEVSVEQLAKTVEAVPRRYMEYTQEFCLSVPIHERVDTRCVHRDGNGQKFTKLMEEDNLFFKDTDEDGTDDEYTDTKIVEDNRIDPFFNLIHALHSLDFRDDQLRSFRWELGTCIPKALLSGSEDSPLRNQKAIQSITLITDGECGTGMSSQYSVDLVQFIGLRTLVWKGLNRYSDFESVKDCIRVRGHQIISLTLDLVKWDRAEVVWTNGFRRQSTGSVPDNFFARQVLNAQPGDETIRFRNLKHLHLSAVSFCCAGAEMLCSFNFRNLYTLKLRNCPGSLEWLQLVLSSEELLRLRSFELALDLNCLQRDDYMRITETICKFIQQAPKLEELYLMLPEPFDWAALTSTISSSWFDLTCFVMHHLVDRGGQDLVDGGIPLPSHLEQVLQGRQLACYGCSTPPGELASQLRKMQPRPSYKLLHIRASGVVLEKLSSHEQPSWSSAQLYNYRYGDDPPYGPDDIFEFAKWAFSDDGLPNLAVLAWGDFSYEGRYSRFSALLGRSRDGYRPLTSADVSFWDIVQNNMDMLASCPLDDIMG